MEYSHLDMGICTDIGKQRKNNEDAGIIIPELGFCAVADGMGGAEAGEIASAWVINEIKTRLQSKRTATPEERCLMSRQAVLKADREIAAFAASNGYDEGSGSTLVSLLFSPWRANEAMVLNVGDSRAYRWRKGILEQISKDHTVAAEAGLSEEQIPKVYRGMLTRAVGTGKKSPPDRIPVDVREEDVFLLCSDGLTKVVPDKKMAVVLTAVRNAAAADIAARMIKEALTTLAPDNITVAVIKIGPLPADAELNDADLKRDQRFALAWNLDVSEEDTAETPPQTYA